MQLMSLIKKRCQEYTEELYKKDLHDPDNHDGVITDLEPDSRGERSPWLPLETRPDSPGEPGMQPRDPCLPWRGKLGPGHTLR